VAGGKRGQAALLLRAITRLLARARLLPWALGLASHTIWALSFAVVLVALIFALAFRNYTLNWETTILEPTFFVRAAHLVGQAPSWLGFPVPDADAVLAPLAATSAQRTWALWLTGCIVVYGLVPRIVFALLCALVWQSRRKALRPDLSEPYYRRLLANFEALEPRQIVDADAGEVLHGAAHGLAPGETDDVLIAIGFELPDEISWPPAGLETSAARTLRVDGSAGARREVLDALARIRPHRAVVGCHASSSPDRGTERFLREVVSHCGECRLWLVGAAADHTASQRWRAWLASAGLGDVRAGDTPHAVLDGWTRP
jgi:hypothetical protein